MFFIDIVLCREYIININTYTPMGIKEAVKMQFFKNILQNEELRVQLACIAVSGAALLASMLDIHPLPFDLAWLAVILCGVPIVWGALKGLVMEFDIKADVLVSIALIASLTIGEDFAAGEIAFIMQLGSLLEEATVARARAGIEKLVRLSPRIARRIADGKEEIIRAEDVRKGEILRVLPGETIPADGVIIMGETSVNQAVMTGEPLPVDKTAGDEVASGTVNQFGSFEMRALKVGEDSSIQRMIRLVQSADAGKAKIVCLADRWATWIVVMALTTAVVTGYITGEVIRAVTVLVVFCPCALVLATPTAVMAAIGNAARHGFLVREGDGLERLAQVKRVAFDKTGTLTYGRPQVAAVKSFDNALTDDDVYLYTASVEKLSEHPLAQAVVTSFAKNVLPADVFKMYAGRGVEAKVNGFKITAGNEKLFAANGIIIAREITAAAQQYAQCGCSIIYVAVNGEAAGFIALADTVRPEAADMLAGVKRAGKTTMLLTGDHFNAAESVAAMVGVDEVYAGCLPEDKLNIIAGYEDKGEHICMLGDGINDAPALKKACTGIAMGGVGSDIAVEAADIVLINDDFREFGHLLELSGQMMQTIRKNIIFSLVLNFTAIVLAVTGLLSPVAGALVHNAGSVAVIISSALLLKWRCHNACCRKQNKKLVHCAVQ